MKKIITAEKAPKAIGPYSHAIQYGKTVYLSGQLGLDPATMELVSEDIHAQVEKTLENLMAVATAAGGNFSNIVKLTIFLTDLAHFSIINSAMEKYFISPYPARTTLQVSALPKSALIEMDAVMVLS
jgi:reactive intermediate/imine deaminase